MRPTQQMSSEALPWRILSVDDDASYRRSLGFTIEDATVLGRPVEFLEAGSYAEAATILTRESDIAMVVLDVVMETDDAGLRLVRAIREVLGNDAVRIVLLSGQLGMAPLADVMHEYDINDYWVKSELTADRLQTLMSANARAYSQIREAARARRRLQLIVESTNALFNSHSVEDFASIVLTEIGTILDIGPDGLVLAGNVDGGDGPKSLSVIGATGRFSDHVGHKISDLGEPEIAAAVETCIAQQQEIAGPHFRVIPFTNTVDGSTYVVYVAIDRALDETETEMLRVFATNVRGGLHNVSLVSRLDSMAYRDALLNIPNRNALVRALDLAITSKNRERLNFVLVDIDNFSSLNAALGTSYGDGVLAQVANRLRSGLGPDVVIARISDDLFGVIGEADNADGARILEMFAPSYDSDAAAEADNITISVSAATLPIRGLSKEPGQIINNTMIALQAAKRNGIGQHCTVDVTAGATAAQRFELLNALKRAIAQKEISVAFQPQIDLQSGEVCGVEMLARWTKADGTPVPPDVFIPLAEKSGLIQPLGEMLFHKACAAAADIDKAAGTALRIAVNVSAIQFARRDLFDRFARIMRQYAISPNRIEIEITESGALGDTAAVRGNFKQYRDAGMDIAIDDFGTGFSSLAYLRQLPAQRLKIDRSFIDEIGREADEDTIADMVIRLGDRFRMRVLAEGVETAAQAAWLRRRLCHEAQGYLFGKPMPLPVLIAWLQSWDPAKALALMAAANEAQQPA
jgi:diguanylate cyclase (GGDEF)-like protein